METLYSFPANRTSPKPCPPAVTRVWIKANRSMMAQGLSPGASGPVEE